MERFEGYQHGGRVIPHGKWESWHADGKRAVYGHLQDGRPDGRRFEWDRDGKLIAIECFRNNELTEYEGSNLSNHLGFRNSLQSFPSHRIKIPHLELCC